MPLALFNSMQDSLKKPNEGYGGGPIFPERFTLAQLDLNRHHVIYGLPECGRERARNFDKCH